jgi:predicted enzyme related to lactoylglutathione lyase
MLSAVPTQVCQVIATEQVHFGKLSPSRERNTIVTIGFGQVVIDSQRADEIAAFWSALLDRPINDGANQFFALIPASDDRAFPALMFLAVPEPRQGKNRMHLDLVATDLPAEVERAVALGAIKIAEFDEFGTRWTTLTDPEGNVFDIGVRHSPGRASGLTQRQGTP